MKPEEKILTLRVRIKNSTEAEWVWNAHEIQ